MADDALDGRPRVVRRDDEEAVDAELVRLPRQMHGVLGRVRARAGDHRRLPAHRVDCGREELDPLCVGERRRLAGRPGDDNAVGAVLDEVRAEPPEGLEVDAEVRLERCDDGGQNFAEHAEMLPRARPGYDRALAASGA